MSPEAPSRPLRVAHVSTVDLTQRFLLLGQLRRLRDEGYDVTAISAPGPWVGDLEAEGIRHLAWPHATRAWNPHWDARAWVELVAILRRERFDLIHTHNPKPGFLGRMAARVVGVPVVVNTVHGFYTLPEDPLPRRGLVLGLEWLAARWSDLELYQSEEDLSWSRRLGVVAGRRSELLGNETDLTRFDPDLVPVERGQSLRSELGIPSDATVIGTIGRYVAEKGYRELFQAAQRIRSVRPDVWFLAAGDADPDKGDALAPDRLPGPTDGFVFAGWRADVPEVLAAMDIFVLPSWREGVPRSAIEAAAMAKPLVVTDIRGCREVVRDGIEGLLVPPRDPGRLAQALLRLVEEPALRDKLAGAARARAVERFDERQVADRVVGAYRSLFVEKGLVARAVRGVRIRPARRGDVAALARLHREIPYAFLYNLGDGFLRELYRGLVADREAVVLVAEGNAGGLEGFVAGAPSVSAFYRRFLLKRGLWAGLAALPTVAARPTMLAKMVQSARYPSWARDLPPAELLSIATAPAARGRGLGRLLVDAQAAALAKRGVDRMKVLVREENEGANRFYESLGFLPAGKLVLHDRRPSHVWVKALAGSEAPQKREVS
jgi:glycosyltransferase involved in cell wall biosynthesis/ribosomal protein S18 acetylase RimI-like enzyme